MNSEYRIRTDRAIEKAIAKNAARPAVKMSGNRGYAVGSVPSPIGDFDFLIWRMASRGYVYDPDTPARGDEFGFRYDPEAAQRHLTFEQARASASYCTFLSYLIQNEQGQIEKSEDGTGALLWPDRVEFWDPENNRTERPLSIFKHFSVGAAPEEGGTEVTLLYDDRIRGVIRGFWGRDLEGQHTGEQRGLAHALRALGIPER